MYYDENEIIHESEENIRENLYLDSDDCFWNEWKGDIIKTIRKYEDYFGSTLKNRVNWGYVLESDVQNEIDYLAECGIKLIVVAKENGLIIYKKEKLEV